MWFHGTFLRSTSLHQTFLTVWCLLHIWTRVAIGVFDGIPSDEARVGIVWGRDEDSPGASGVLIRDRCVLTSAHLFEFFRPERFALPYANHSNGVHREVVRARVHPRYQREAPDRYKYDLALLWLKGNTCSNAESGFDCADGEAEFPRPFNLIVDDQPIPPDGAVVEIVGYGLREEDSSFGHQTRGWMRLARYIAGDSRVPRDVRGALFEVEPLVHNPQWNCKGDSGGAAIYGGKLLGIMSASDNARCYADKQRRTGEIITFQNSNGMFVSGTALDRFCRPKISVELSVDAHSAAAGNHVAVHTIDPLGESLPRTTIVASHGFLEDTVEVTLQAIAAEGSVFERWDAISDHPLEACPCALPGVGAVCSFRARDLAPDFEESGVHCTAIFNTPE